MVSTKREKKKETGKWYGTFPVTHGNYSLRRQYYVVLHQIRFHISVFLLLTPLISPQQLEAAVKAELFFFSLANLVRLQWHSECTSFGRSASFGDMLMDSLKVSSDKLHHYGCKCARALLKVWAKESCLTHCSLWQRMFFFFFNSGFCAFFTLI